MQEALDAMRRARTPFEHLLYGEDGRIIHIVNENTIKALLRRELIVEDHRIRHPQPWIVDNVFYRLNDAEDEMERWLDANFPLPKSHSRYKSERQLFALIWMDYMHMEPGVGLVIHYPSEAYLISDIAYHSRFSYSWLI